MKKLTDWKCDKCGREFKNVIPPVRGCCKSRGLGDTVAKITRKLGIEPCVKCKKRQQKLNEMFPYKEKDNGK